MKPISVQEAGRKGGLVGGKSTSEAKRKAVRENIKKAQKMRWAKVEKLSPVDIDK